MSYFTPWYPAEMSPVHVGEYGVSHTVVPHWNSKGYLTGRPFRWWDGERWLTHKGGRPSAFGSHKTHQWRGVTEAYYREYSRLIKLGKTP